MTSRSRLRIAIDPKEAFYRHAYFTGEYEPGVSRVLRAILQPGDTCVDAGANIGWHTVHMAQAVGPTGHVHAFEPHPQMHAILAANILNNGFADRVTAHAVGLMDREQELTIRRPAGHSAAHASVSPSMNGGTAHIIRTDALDSVLGCAKVAHCRLMKLDIEGAERSALAGARQLLGRPDPPVLLVEAAVQTSAGFGYTPNDILDDVASRAKYRTFIVHEASGRLTPLVRFPPGHIGANILMVPEASAGLARGLVRSLGIA